MLKPAERESQSSFNATEKDERVKRYVGTAFVRVACACQRVFGQSSVRVFRKSRRSASSREVFSR